MTLPRKTSSFIESQISAFLKEAELRISSVSFTLN